MQSDHETAERQARWRRAVIRCVFTYAVGVWLLCVLAANDALIMRGLLAVLLALLLVSAQLQLAELLYVHYLQRCIDVGMRRKAGRRP